MKLHPLAAIVVIGAALAGCGKMGDLERPGPMIGKGSGADAGANADSARTVRTIDPRTRDDRPAPPRTLPIDSAQNPTASAPQGALPDPYANPR